ncbi:MAG: polyribonucleotide nucleotidyltransferase [Patescibacteria group bacterium]
MDLARKIYKTSVRGEEVSLEVSKIAGQANAAVLGRHGDTAVLAAVVMSEQDKSGDFFPLTVDYEERFYAAGKILGSRFVRREGRATDDAVLSARVIDRTIRPLFDPRLRREVQVVITILSYEEKNDPDFIALLSASAALAISDIPWNGPVAGMKIISPENGDVAGYQAYFAGTDKKINMIEFEGKEISENLAEKVFAECFEEIKKLVAFQRDIAKEIGKPKAQVALAAADPKTQSVVNEFLKEDLEEALAAKHTEGLRKKILEHLEKAGENESVLNSAEVFFEEEVDKYVHTLAIEKDKRVDGRKMDEVRDLHAEAGLFKRVHGSALFCRGETQVLAMTTLATPEGKQLVENMEGTVKKRFMLNYNFPGFATGETGRSNRGPGRREIGHGALAAKAVAAMLPSEEEFPYAIRVVAETLSSNGSSSMASTCATSLSLMDAGIPLKKQVAGISIGLMSDESGRYKLLTDIQGPEDHYGDMDFKVAGTRDGINAIQMDVKVDGITLQIFNEALQAAKKARFQILDVMDKTLSAPRPDLSPFAPRITTIQIPVENIGQIIGPGGKTINGILAQTQNKVTIDIEEDGRIFIAGTDSALVAQAVSIIKGIAKDVNVGEMVEGTIIKILDFGAIVDLGGGKDGMIHVSELKDGFVKKVEDVVKVGDFVRAKVIRSEDGKIGLSLKQVAAK